MPDDELVALAAPAVWRVETNGCDWLGVGTAFAVTEHHLVTNQHVIANDVSPDVVSPSGTRLAGRVLGFDRNADVAVIEVAEALPAVLTWAPTDALRPAERIVTIGFPAPSLEFTATSGSIVNFQGAGGVREAILTDAPINRGNSGGPGLRADATVAGVVTQMSLEATSERAAIIFTTQSVFPLVEAFIAAPSEVVSDCSQGPDYVPPLPEDFDVPAVPPAPPDTIAATGTTSPTSRPPRPDVVVPTTERIPSTTRPTTVTTSPCPEGEVGIVVDQVTSTPVDDSPGYHQVIVSGTVFNGTTMPVTIERIDVLIPGEPPREAVGFPDNAGLAPSVATRWEAADFVFDPNGVPDEAEAALAWSFVDPAFSSCN